MSTSKEWKEDSLLSKHDLDSASEVMSSLHRKWAYREVQASEQEESANLFVQIRKEELDEAKSRADLELRGMTVEEINKLLGLNLSEATIKEAAYKSAIEIHPAVIKAKLNFKEARQDLIQKKRNHNEFKRAVKSMEIKNDNIDHLIYLHGQGYFMRASREMDQIKNNFTRVKYSETIKQQLIAQQQKRSQKQEQSEESSTTRRIR